MIDLESWIRDIRLLSRMLCDKDLGYPVESNGLSTAPSLEELAALKSRFPELDLVPLVSFYTRCNGASFPDLWNGYFIHPIKLVLREHDNIPTRVEGTSSREVLQFGGDGGGNLFALSRGSQPQVLFLPKGLIRASVYRESMQLPMKVMADTFDEFLEKLQQDLRAFVEDTPGWQYMIP